MPKVIVTMDLADTLKTMRLERKMPAKALAEKLGKTPSYVSKLESAMIKTLEEEELIKILRFIVDNTDDINEITDQLYKALSFKYSNEEINQMVWVDNVDTVYRKLPVNESLINDIKKRMSDSGISVDQLVMRINNNEALPQELKEDPNCPENIWIAHKKGNGENGVYIKIRTDSDRINNLIAMKLERTNYVTLLAIVYYLTKIERYKDVEEISSDQNRELNNESNEYLENFKVYKMIRKQEIIENAKNEHELSEKLSLHDTENIRIFNDVLDSLSFYSSYDIISANGQMKQFVENMHWDSAFIMQIAGLEFSKLGTCSYRIKRRIISDIKDVLQNALDLPESERRREEY